MKKPRLIVQKFGGATVADATKIKGVAERVHSLRQQGTQVVAVVSAMGKTTNQLIELAQQVSSRPNRRELDMLLTTGERVSMALLSMALHDLGSPAISFTGSQAGILTDDSHVSAFIEDVKAFRVRESLDQGKTVVLAGYQGVSPRTKEITTLGRGGTDTTAVAIAAYLEADHCEILKDVPGVFSADPTLIKSAKVIPQISYDQMLEMTFWGAKVLHYRSVELAKQKQVPIFIGPAQNKSATGTWVRKENQMFESKKVLSVNSHEKVLVLEVQAATTGEAFRKLDQFFNQNEIADPQILGASHRETKIEVFVTGPSEILEAIKKENSQGLFKLRGDFSSVSATCTGAVSFDFQTLIVEKLTTASIPTHEVWNSSMSVSVLVPRSEREKTIETLHQLS